MPSERFLHLPEEKKRVIWKAAFDEFTHVPYEKVSINKIIQRAGISRGSFYTYFDDKRELLSFLLENTKVQWREFCLRQIRACGGNFWGMMEAVAVAAVNFCRENDMVRLHHNIVNASLKGLIEEEDELYGFVRQIYEETDTSRFRERSPNYFRMVMEMMMSVVTIGIMESCKEPMEIKQIMENYQKRVNIIRYGVCSETEKDRMEEAENE